MIRDMFANPAKYAKFWAALGTAFVEAAALWTSAPSWVVVTAGFVGSFLVVRVPNREPL